ncbi:MAG TPA: mercuric reductase [Myxococcota bacterium]|nr:mercuric reductase [Myxococcota bacterium]
MSGGPELAPADAWNRALLESVHPPGWRNPTPAPRYDLVVLGGGTAGLVSAIVSAGLGARVALVEKALLGGDCLNVGCVPSKTLIRAARAAADARAATQLGVRAGPVEVDFAAVMERVRRVRAEIAPHDSAQRYAGLGVDVFLGHGRFTGRDALEVGGASLRFKRAVVATGARAAPPAIPGLAEAGFLTNETVFSLVERPARLAVIGAGPIGCELAQAFQRLGSRVTLIEVAEQVLIREDPDAAALVRAALERDGVEIVLGAKLERVERRAGAKALVVATPTGTRELAADEILVGIGRAPNVEDLGLERAGVAFQPGRGVVVDARLRTSNPRVFAAGDVCLATKFTHAADASAKLVVRNALFFGRRRAADLIMPWCTYTDPEVAHVGLYAREAEARGIAVDSYQAPLAANDRARADGDADGFLKLHVRKGGDRIVGATLVARHAGEGIAPIATAMAAGVGLGRLVDLILPYPTQTELLKNVAGAYTRTRLTPLAARVLRGLIRLAR